MFSRFCRLGFLGKIVAKIIIATLMFVVAHAQNINNDKNLLDTLVERGILTESEALQTRKKMSESSEMTVQKPLATSLALGFYTQIRYQFSHQRATEGNLVKTRTANGAAVRRVIFLYDAHFNDTTNMIVVLNLVEPSPFDSFYVKKKIDTSVFKGAAHFGVMKPDFNMEYTAAAKLKVPERSTVNSYFGGKDVGYDDYYHESNPNQCLAGNHIGVFWKGIIPFDERFIWGASITNAKNAYWNKIDHNIELAYWWNIGYAVKNDEHDFQTGLNFAYSPNVSYVYNPHTNDKQKSETFGTSAYFIYQGKHLFLQGEACFTISEHGKTISDSHAIYTTNSKEAIPFGAFMIVGYAFDISQIGIMEPVARIAYIDTDGAGVAENNVIYSIKKSLNGYYNKVHSYYVGFNLYFDKLNRRNFKLAVGLEHFRFYDSPTSSQSKHCNVNVFISQIQVAF